MLLLAKLNAQQTKTTTIKSTTSVNNCDEIKKENEFLKKTLKIQEPIKFYEDEDLEIKIIAAKGNLKTQIIKIDYLITNKKRIKTITMDARNEKYISVEGEMIPLAKGYTVYNTELNTDVPVKTSVEIGTILPENTTIKLITLRYILTDATKVVYGFSPSIIAEFKDVQIDWK
jgi:hypothetical protein